MRTIGRMAAAVLAATVLFTLAACGGGASSTSSAATSTVEVSETSSTAVSSTVDPAVASFAQEWSAKLAGPMSWPTAAEPTDVVAQHTDLTKLQTEFLTKAAAAGIRLADYPMVKSASDTLVSTLTEFDAASCALAQPKSATALTCGAQLLTAKMNAQALGSYLTVAAAG